MDAKTKSHRGLRLRRLQDTDGVSAKQKNGRGNEPDNAGKCASKREAKEGSRRRKRKLEDCDKKRPAKKQQRDCRPQSRKRKPPKKRPNKTRV